MERFEGRIAVITGGGTGMGRELARQLAARGCHLAMCDVSQESMAQTKALCEAESRGKVRVSTFVADVSDERQVCAFRDDVAAAHETDHVHLLFNNAGIGGGGSFVLDDREEWDKTFAVCWNGVYHCTRAFLPLLLASEEGHLVNTSSVNGFWASLGPQSAHTAYSAAKFAVKGFSEALVNDFRLNAPHLKVSVVMPGHIGTSIVINSGKILGRDPKEMTDEQVAEARDRIARQGFPVQAATNDQIRQALTMLGESFRDNAPMTAAEAAKVILDGVREERWRILVGRDAEVLDRLVRETPEEAYEPSFMERVLARTPFGLGR
ncbi:MAG TPA: SDR family NAD(P)-dependent oxidoreductase [Myxococcota bacterium]|jgi:NAD(P)-dependent dehydrogenase (short-subunit alcohol dehydrogenase family)|nr:SDR family NAD(P)-dependent oxidoreductase [Myxococcota bacterium]